MLALQYDNVEQRADLVRNGGNFVQDNGLESAVVISLFSNARRNATDEKGASRGGWWADAFADDVIGSRLWVFDRAVGTQESANQYAAAAKAALQWMIDDGVATNIATSAVWVKNQVISLTVSITQPGDAGVWTKTWEAQANAV